MAEKLQLRMPGDSEGKHPADVLLKIQTAQINQLYRQTVGGLLGVLVVAILASVILWEVIPHVQLEVWLVSMLLITAIRGGLTLVFQRKAPTGRAIKLWAHLHAVFSALSALAFGGAILFALACQSSHPSTGLAHMHRFHQRRGRFDVLHLETQRCCPGKRKLFRI